MNNGTEIERKYNVLDVHAALADATEVWDIRQGLIMNEWGRMLRVRTDLPLKPPSLMPIDPELARHVLCFKHSKSSTDRTEVEFECNDKQAEQLFASADSMLHKRRYWVPCKLNHNFTWEIDVFLDKNDGLVTAEMEVPSAAYPIVLPRWVGRELTYDGSYLNTRLSELPYSEWDEEDLDVEHPCTELFEKKEFGDLMTVQEFMAAAFVNSDGTGYYAFADRKSGIPVDCRDFRAGHYDKYFTHVMWYNK